jgi:hypothetical protein
MTREAPRNTNERTHRLLDVDFIVENDGMTWADRLRWGAVYHHNDRSGATQANGFRLEEPNPALSRRVSVLSAVGTDLHLIRLVGLVDRAADSLAPLGVVNRAIRTAIAPGGPVRWSAASFVSYDKGPALWWEVRVEIPDGVGPCVADLSPTNDHLPRVSAADGPRWRWDPGSAR